MAIAGLKGGGTPGVGINNRPHPRARPAPSATAGKNRKRKTRVFESRPALLILSATSSEKPLYAREQKNTNEQQWTLLDTSEQQLATSSIGVIFLFILSCARLCEGID
jgi:hypothetical protein